MPKQDDSHRWRSILTVADGLYVFGWLSVALFSAAAIINLGVWATQFEAGTHFAFKKSALWLVIRYLLVSLTVTIFAGTLRAIWYRSIRAGFLGKSVCNRQGLAEEGSTEPLSSQPQTTRSVSKHTKRSKKKRRQKSNAHRARNTSKKRAS